MKVNIHNQCSGFKLTNGGFFSVGTSWSWYPHTSIDTGDTMSVEFDSFLARFEGVIAYKLQKECTKTNEQPEPTHIRLFIAWKSECYKKFCVFIHLVEYNEMTSWYQFTSEEYYQRYTNQLNTYTSPIKDIWLMHDGTVLKTELDLDFTQRDGVLNITISEGVEDDYTRRSIWINPKM
jgi:hypothetical protein